MQGEACLPDPGQSEGGINTDSKEGTDVSILVYTHLSLRDPLSGRHVRGIDRFGAD
jgi:hypothetical protein